MTLLSVGIPTYSRKKIVCKNVGHILSDDFLSECDINLIVSDNNSPDDTLNSLQKVLKNSKSRQQNLSRVKVNCNDENLGVFGNIFKLFELCESKYLLITADEEFLIKDSIPKLMHFLEMKNPTFLCPQMFNNGKLYRGSRETKLIPVSDWERAGFFASGLIFDVEKTRKIIDKFYHLLTANNLYYVQNLLICELMVDSPNTQWYVDFPVCEKKFSAPTEISTNDTFQYWTVPGRWLGFLATENYFKARILGCRDIYYEALYHSFISDNRNQLYSFFIHAIAKTHPEVVKEFRSGVFRSEFGRFSFILIGIKSFYYWIRRVVRWK